MGVRPSIGGGGDRDGFNSEEFGKELEMLLREQQRDRERELSLYRSGSAPPTIDGSHTTAGAGGLFAAGISGFGQNGNVFQSEEEFRSDPAYLSYYYSNVNRNPRLPPPLLSKEDWRSAQRVQAGVPVVGGIGDRRKANRTDEGVSRSLFSHQSGMNLQKDMEGDGLFGSAPGGKQKYLADAFHDGLGWSTPMSMYPSHAASHAAFDVSVEPLGSAELHLANLHNEITSADGLRAGGKVQHLAGAQSIGSLTSLTFASVVGASLSRSKTADPHLVARAPSPSLPPVGVRTCATEKKTNSRSISFNDVSPSITEPVDIVTARLSGMNLSGSGVVDNDNHVQSKFQQEIEDHHKFPFDLQEHQNNVKHPYLKDSDSGFINLSSAPQSVKSLHPHFCRSNVGVADLSHSILLPKEQDNIHMPALSTTSSYLKPPAVRSQGSSPAHHQNTATVNSDFISYGLSGYSINPALPSMLTNHLVMGNSSPLFENAAATSMISSLSMDSRALGGDFSLGPNLSGMSQLQNFNGIGNHASTTALQMPLLDPLHFQYPRTAEYATQVAANFSDSSFDRNYMVNSYLDVPGFQKAYLEALLSSQKQYGMPFMGRRGDLNHGQYGNPAFGFGMSFGGNPLMGPVIPGSPVGPGSPLGHSNCNICLPSGARNLFGGVTGSWQSDIGNFDEGFASSLLEEFKSNKSKCFELSEIAGHVAEFSADQYGSRFIQQKLETATAEEKNMVFEEIFPQALSLMTDVFGNYVIQKFFEHGTATQRTELANELIGHVLTLSLQMYGCRVIQKAIEVVDLNQQTKMVAELESHVMRCVRDQNGNHVIQKCIECIPQDAIQFIISTFYDQVVTLSTHPYGCRVIQRVLEHCDDPETQRIVMDEILQCVCMLAQDQYGNYVVQHVLEHGKPHERSAIINKLAGQIVQMSQQKFASNVVEKCLTFGCPMERQVLVKEILGSTDENEPLQAMMKDQFANYVVQKVLETCDDQQRELILSRIKVHLNALKKYTYGKHIVARVEKLIAAGERRIGVQSPYLLQTA